jgi:hypothetical protein
MVYTLRPTTTKNMNSHHALGTYILVARFVMRMITGLSAGWAGRMYVCIFMLVDQAFFYNILMGDTNTNNSHSPTAPPNRTHTHTHTHMHQMYSRTQISSQPSPSPLHTSRQASEARRSEHPFMQAIRISVLVILYVKCAKQTPISQGTQDAGRKAGEEGKRGGTHFVK